MRSPSRQVSATRLCGSQSSCFSVRPGSRRASPARAAVRPLAQRSVQRGGPSLGTTGPGGPPQGRQPGRSPATGA